MSENIQAILSFTFWFVMLPYILIVNRIKKIEIPNNEYEITELQNTVGFELGKECKIISTKRNELRLKDNFFRDISFRLVDKKGRKYIYYQIYVPFPWWLVTGIIPGLFFAVLSGRGIISKFELVIRNRFSKGTNL